MGKIDEMRDRLAKLESTSFALSEEEKELDALARKYELHQIRIDNELSERLQTEARIAFAEVKSNLLAEDPPRDIPVESIWSLNAYKLCGVGWLVLGPDDSGQAALALKQSGRMDGSGKGFKVQERDPDKCRVVVGRATLASPVPKADLTNRLMLAPEFVVACSLKVEQLGGAHLLEVAGK